MSGKSKESCRYDGDDVRLIFACSGGADVGHLSDQAARLLMKEGVGKMFCLAGIGGRVEGILQTTEDANSLLVIDGCPVDCARKTLEEAGIEYTGFYLNGLAGQGKGEESAIATAKMFNELKPKSIGITSLTLVPDTELYEQKLKGEFIESTEYERILELKCFIEHLETNTMVIANHVTMATPIVGKNPEEKAKMLQVLQHAIDNFDEDELRRYRENLNQL